MVPQTNVMTSPSPPMGEGWMRRFAAGLRAETAQAMLAEQEAHRARHAAEAASRAKTDFLANMSHEMRTPLNGLMGMTELILADADLSDHHRVRLSKVQYAADVLKTLVDDILDFSALEAGCVELAPAPFDLGTLIDAALAIVAPLASRKGLPLEGPLPARTDLPLVVGDDDRIRQILLNLLNNAIKFTRGGSVRVRLSTEASGGALSVSIAIEDTGIGIAASKLPHLFDRFNRIDPAARRVAGGSGLGLAISRHLATLMGGTIEVESRPGHGSTFRLALVLPLAGHAVPTCPVSSPAVTPRRILLAEDCELNQEVAVAILTRQGHRVDIARDGVEALQAVQNSRYDLVLMDISMPNMDGIAATDRIRALGGHAAGLPIIALTANVLRADVARLRDEGFDDHLGKPFRAAELTGIVERWSRDPLAVVHAR